MKDELSEYESESESPPAKMRRTRPTLKYPLSEADTFKLIAAVKTHGSIWNAASEDYSNKSLRAKAWKEIAAGFQRKFSEQDLRIKWKNLRIQYRSNATAQRNKENPKKPWKYSAAMSFIGKGEELQEPEACDSIDSQLDGESPASDNESDTVVSTPLPARLSEADIFRLIAAVKLHGCIWNAACEDYNIKGRRDKAWKEIAAEFPEYAEEDLRTKWSNLRIQYRSNASDKRSKAGNKKPWKYYASMLFIEDSQAPEHLDRIDCFDESQLDAPSPLSTPTFPKRARPSVNDTNEILRTLRSALSALQRTNEEDKDTDTIFCKYVYKELNAMSPATAKKCRIKILQCLLDEDNQ